MRYQVGRCVVRLLCCVAAAVCFNNQSNHTLHFFPPSSFHKAICWVLCPFSLTEWCFSYSVQATGRPRQYRVVFPFWWWLFYSSRLANWAPPVSAVITFTRGLAPFAVRRASIRVPFNITASHPNHKGSSIGCRDFVPSVSGFCSFASHRTCPSRRGIVVVVIPSTSVPV